MNPTNATIVWDRIPMTISFMSFFSIIIGEFINQKKGALVLLPLIIIGIGSVFYWQYTESIGVGDLRLYFIVQFFPMLLIPLIILLFKQKKQSTLFILLVLLAYIFAKIFEMFDHSVLKYTTQISGHTIKHFFAAIAPVLFLYSIKNKIQN